MKFKLDENFGRRTQRLYQTAGHDIKSVLEQQLSGCSDEQLYEICISEKRCLVTLDLDFADTMRFPPAKGSGIAVIRVPRNPSLELLERMIQQFLQAVAQMPIKKQLWIVESSRIRIHESETEND